MKKRTRMARHDTNGGQKVSGAGLRREKAFAVKPDWQKCLAGVYYWEPAKETPKHALITALRAKVAQQEAAINHRDNVIANLHGKITQHEHDNSYLRYITDVLRAKERIMCDILRRRWTP